MGKPILETERLLLRPFCLSDVESLRAGLNNQKISRRLTNIPYPYTLDSAREWIWRMRDEEEKKPRKHFDLAITEKGGVGIVGSVAFINIDDHRAQVSYWLAEAHEGKGYVCEALRALVRYGFEVLGFVRIYGYTFHENFRSQRVLEKAGFLCEGVCKMEWKRIIAGNPVYFDSHIYAIVKPQWEASNF